MSPLKLLSVNVGMPREVDWQGRLVRTSIFKSPVSGPVRVTTLNLEGDEQSDLTVHGGSIKQSMPTHLSTTGSGAKKFPA
jgi:MOSC domain-containing protein YiiM